MSHLTHSWRQRQTEHRVYGEIVTNMGNVKNVKRQHSAMSVSELLSKKPQTGSFSYT